MPYGTLRVPVAAIRRIDVARRLLPELAARIEQGMAGLASADQSTSKAAAESLLEIGEPASGALTKAARSVQHPLATRAKEVLERMQEQHGKEPLKLREYDVVQTADFRLVGRITSPVVGLQTTQFGPLTLKLADVRSLQSVAFAQPPEEEYEALPKEVLPDPGSLTGHQQFIGQTFLFKVTGAAGGSVWGTDVYTSDSTLATVAVHAGVLKVGETGVVQVKIVAPPASFAGSVRHGVTTMDYGPYSGAYEAKKPKTKVPAK